MQQNTCDSCAHYRRHYVLVERKIIQIHCGHCTNGKMKSKRPTAKACEAYIPAEPPENAFVSKEYLSKELLAYMIKLELLPPVCGIGESE